MLQIGRLTREMNSKGRDVYFHPASTSSGYTCSLSHADVTLCEMHTADMVHPERGHSMILIGLPCYRVCWLSKAPSHPVAYRGRSFYMVTATGAVIGIVYLRFWKGWALTSFLPVTKDTLNSGLSVLRTGV